jgi:hypothetical protein
VALVVNVAAMADGALAVQATQAAAAALQVAGAGATSAASQRPDAKSAVQDRPMSPAGSEAGIGADPVPSGDPFEAAIERLKEFHCLASADGSFRLNTDLWLTQDFMVFDRPPPSLVRTGEWQTYWPQLNGLMAMEFGEHLSLVALGQVYRGFDPVDQSLSANLSEYFAVIQPFDSRALVLKGGTFATCFGQWVNRHFSFQNPLINAPLMYEGMTGVSDGSGNVSATPSRAAFLNRRNLVQNVPAWLPIVWGPSYTSGGQVGGTAGAFDYAVELKNASLSSRPSEWQFWQKDFADPTVTGRVGWRPDAAWTFGVSGSGGSFIAADPLTTRSMNAWDSTQTVVGADVSWAHGPLQVWSEFAFSRWRIPGLEPADAYSYFVEAKWKFAQQLWLAGRWNQQFYGDYGAVGGGTTSWGDDTWRIDACLGWKLDRFVQLKAQYTYTGQVGFDQQSPSTFALQLVVEF